MYNPEHFSQKMKSRFGFHMNQIKYSTLENQDEELRPRPSYTAQLLGLLLNVQQPLQNRFEKILSKLNVSVVEESEGDGGHSPGQCLRCGQCVLPPFPLTGEQQIYPQ